MQTTGSAISGSFVVANLLATQNSGLTFAVSPNIGTPSILTMSLAVDVFDGSVWHISFGRQRADEIASAVSSSYFLRAAKQSFGELTTMQVSPRSLVLQ
jgi:hypothetical protein